MGLKKTITLEKGKVKRYNFYAGGRASSARGFLLPDTPGF
jgi:hypothetical protein